MLLRWTLSLPCPHCGSTLVRSGLGCLPAKRGREFSCAACRRQSQLPVARRLAAWIVQIATLAAGIPLAYRILDIPTTHPQLMFAGFMLASLAVFALSMLLASMVGAGSRYLVPCPALS
jgi:hypothetical protein